MTFSKPSAESVEAMLSEVDRLEAVDNLSTISSLAYLDRSAPGIIATILQGVIRITIALTLMFIFGMLVFLALPEIAWRVWNFIASLNPIYHYGPSGLPIYNLHIFQFGWIFSAIAACGFLIRNEQFRSEIKNTSLWIGTQQPAIPFLIILTPFRLVSWGLMSCLWWASCYFALLPIWVTIRNVIAISLQWIDHPAVAAALIFPIFDGVLAPAAWFILFIFMIIIWRLRRTPREKLIRIILLTAGFLGFIEIGLNAYRSDIPLHIVVPVTILFLAYPLKLPIPLGRLLKMPYGIYRDELAVTWSKIKLRYTIGQVLRKKLKQNRERIKKDSWASVCKVHRVRLDTQWDRISYFRWITYSYCPLCKDDHQLFTGVECIALLFDKKSTEDVTQVGNTLVFNGFRWLENKSPVPRTDAIIFGKVEEADIEAFISAYSNARNSPQYKPINKIVVRLSQDFPIDSNSYAIRSMQSVVSQITSGYEVSSMLSPGPIGLRMQEAVLYHAIKAQLLLRKLLVWATVVLILFCLGWLATRLMNQMGFMKSTGSTLLYLERTFQRTYSSLQRLWADVARIFGL